MSTWASPNVRHGSIDGERLLLDVKTPPRCDGDPRPVEAGVRGEGYRASYITVMSVAFAGFVDYAVIVPSAKAYCDHLHTSSLFYVVVLALHPLARILTLPLTALAGAAPAPILAVLSECYCDSGKDASQGAATSVSGHPALQRGGLCAGRPCGSAGASHYRQVRRAAVGLLLISTIQGARWSRIHECSDTPKVYRSDEPA